MTHDTEKGTRTMNEVEQYSPGPWRGQYDTQVVDYDGNNVALVFDHNDLQLTQANKHLIVAAPELLEALILMLSRFDESKSSYGFVTKADLSSVRAAIAKALGATDATGVRS